MPLEDFARFVRANRTFVAVAGDGRPLGFAIAGPVGGIFWLKELGVDPDAMRRGVGTALLDAVAGHAQDAGFATVGLSTFRDVPFNAPFYARRGYRIVDPDTQPEPIRGQFAREVPESVTPGDRVLMLRNL